MSFTLDTESMETETWKLKTVEKCGRVLKVTYHGFNKIKTKVGVSFEFFTICGSQVGVALRLRNDIRLL